MKNYLDLMQKILSEGVEKEDRTGTGTISLFGEQLRFDLSEGLPAVTTKKLHFKSIIHELLWFIRGETNIGYLKANGVSIWDAWADENGDLGPVYGKQWRAWKSPDGSEIDQIASVIETLKNDPDSRRMIVNSWNVADLSGMALTPCHCMFQFYTRKLENGKRALSCQLYQRSADFFLGVPFNIASYAILTHMVAQVVGMVPDEFVLTFGDVHIYSNHVDQAHLQLSREPMDKPDLVLNPHISEINDFTFDDIKIARYKSHGKISAPIAV